MVWLAAVLNLPNVCSDCAVNMYTHNKLSRSYEETEHLLTKFPAVITNQYDNARKKNYGKWTKRNTPVVPNWFQPCQCCCCLCYPGKYPGLGTLVRYKWAQVLEACDSLSGLAKTILQGTVKGERRQGIQKKRREGNIKDLTGLEFAKSQTAMKNREKWRKVVVKLSAVPQRSPRLRDGWRWRCKLGASRTLQYYRHRR